MGSLHLAGSKKGIFGRAASGGCGLLVLALAAFLSLHKLAYLDLMPGDVGDARLNNYFLELIYQFLVGGSQSLLDSNFFYPFPYVMGFSDNLFGSSPIYLIARAVTGQPDTAFQIWFLVGYVVNFAAAYYALRKLGRGEMASAIGALIFAFALPVSAHSGHAQLHYRFGVPLAILASIEFFRRKRPRSAVVAFFWLVWQFYCSIYIGFFLSLFIGVMVAVYVVHTIWSGRGLRHEMSVFVLRWTQTKSREKVALVFVLAVSVLLLVLLFYPYIQVTVVYGLKRSWAEIASMVPRPQSYLLSDVSWFWASRSPLFANLPMRHEHQMFVGVLPMLLAVAGVIVGSKRESGLAYVLLTGALVTVVLITLSIGGFTLWYIFAKLPLASSIRAMTRIDLVLLFPVAFLSAIAIDQIVGKRSWGFSAAIGLLALLMVEAFATSPPLSSKQEWRNRLSAKEQLVPEGVRADAVLMFAQSNGPFYADELDAMWVALQRGFPTLNGYSGSFPPGYSIEYGRDCAEVPKRVAAFFEFSGQQGDKDAYRKLADRVLPLGFIGCDPQWQESPPSLTYSNRAYTADEFKQLSLQEAGHEAHYGVPYVVVRIVNSGRSPFSAASSIGHPIRLSWRFIDASGQPMRGWDGRKDLSADIPASGKIHFRIPIDQEKAKNAPTVEVSIVQEGGQDVGMPPLTIDLKSP